MDESDRLEMAIDREASEELASQQRLADRVRAESAIGQHRMIVCNLCGNKRCPHANDINNACTGSNEPGQPGSAYPSHPLTEPLQEVPSRVAYIKTPSGRTFVDGNSQSSGEWTPKPSARRRLVFDCETAPLSDAAKYLEDPEPPANYSKPETIAKWIAEKRAEQLERCSLDPDLCRVVAIGWQRECDKLPVSLCGTAESENIRAFWNHAEDCHLIGYNCLGFDLPVLMRRSLYLGIKVPDIAIDRFKHPQVTDLMQLLSFSGALKFRGLNFYCKRFGIEVPDEIDGSQIAAAVAAGEWSKVERHVTSDVEKTARLATRMGLFQVEKS